METFERIAKVLMYIVVPAVIVSCLVGGDFLPLPFTPQHRVIGGLVVGAGLGLWFGFKRKFQ